MNEPHHEMNFVKHYEPGKKSSVLLKNGKIVDVKNGRYLDQGLVLIIDGGKVRSILDPAVDHSIPAADFSIDLQGKTLMPGLFNTHCHITINTPTLIPDLKDIKRFKQYGEKQVTKNMRECLAHGVTHIRDAYCEDLRPARELKAKIASGKVPGPRIIQAVVVGPTGSYLAEKHSWFTKKLRSVLGIPVLDHLRPESGVVQFPVNASQKQVRDAVDRAVDERGAEAIKIGEQRENLVNYRPTSIIMTMGQLTALADQAAKRKVRSMMHHVSVASFRRAVKAGIPSLAHQPMDDHLTSKDADSFIRAGCVLDATASVAYGLCWKLQGVPHFDHPSMDLLTDFRDKTFAGLANHFLVPELKTSAMKLYDRLSNKRIKLWGLLNMLNRFKYYSGIIHHGMNNLRLLYNQGARIACANDGGIPPLTLAMMQHEIDILALFLNQGRNGKILSGADAIRIATLNSALSMGLEDDFGSIEPGKTADLVIIDGDPLEDPHLIGSPVAALFMDGRLVIDNCGLQIETRPDSRAR